MYSLNVAECVLAENYFRYKFIFPPTCERVCDCAFVSAPINSSVSWRRTSCHRTQPHRTHIVEHSCRNVRSDVNARAAVRHQQREGELLRRWNQPSTCTYRKSSLIFTLFVFESTAFSCCFLCFHSHVGANRDGRRICLTCERAFSEVRFCLLLSASTCTHETRTSQPDMTDFTRVTRAFERIARPIALKAANRQRRRRR